MARIASGFRMLRAMRCQARVGGVVFDGIDGTAVADEGHRHFGLGHGSTPSARRRCQHERYLGTSQLFRSICAPSCQEYRPRAAKRERRPTCTSASTCWSWAMMMPAAARISLQAVDEAGILGSAWSDQFANVHFVGFGPGRAHHQVDGHIAGENQRQARRNVGEDHLVAVFTGQLREDRQHGFLRGIETGVRMQGAVVAQVPGGVFGQLRKRCQGTGNEVVQWPAVQAIGVVAVVIVLEHHLPVPGKHTAGLRVAGQFGIDKIVTVDRFFHVLQPGRQGRCVSVEVYKNETQPGFHLERWQPDFGLVEIFGSVHCRTVRQCPVQAVTPLVVRTDEAAGVAAAFRDQHGTVPAHGRHGAQFAVKVADDDERLADDGGGEKVAGAAHLGLAADAEPFVVEDRLFFEFVELRVCIADRRQGLRPLYRQDGTGEGIKERIGQQ